MKKSTYRVCGMALALAIALGSATVTTGNVQAKTEKTAKLTVADAVSGAPVTAISGPVALDKTEINAMAGKSVKLSVVNITGGSSVAHSVSFASDNEAVAKQSKIEYAADFTSVTCTIDLLAKGETVIRANVGGNTLTCNIRVVKAFGKSDFSLYRGENIVTTYKRYRKRYAWYYDGEWGKLTGSAKYGSTYRGIRIGSSLEDFKKAYGDPDLKKCSKKKDPFLYEKKFNSGKKLKVANYAEYVYKSGKVNYRLRFYFTSAGKVHGFIFLANKSFEKISKADYRKARRKGEKLV